VNSELLIRDPVFQLNLLLWMAKEQPPQGYVVRPVFFQSGFGFIYIENPFKFPQETLAAIENACQDISKEPEPELLLGRRADNAALYLEAKADSFSPASTNAKQARGHLLAVGPAFAEVMDPYQSCLLCYVVPEEKCQLMRECLTDLSTGLLKQGLQPGPHSSHGLAVQGQNLHYSWDDVFRQHVGVGTNSSVVMSGLKGDTDPSPLFIIYIEEDYADESRRDLLRRVMINQVHALLVSDLNLLPLGETYERSASSILLDMTDGVFQYLGRERQKGMRRLVTENVFRRITEFSKDRFPGLVSRQADSLRIRFTDQTLKESFLEWLEDFKRTAFRTDRPSANTQLAFFRSPEDD